MSDLRMPQCNSLTLSGRLCRDPELKYTQSGKAAIKTSMAVDSGFGDNKKTMFVTLQLWGDYAEKMHRVLYKGCPLLVEGRLDIYEYENRDGVKQRETVCIAHRVQVLEWQDKEPPESRPQSEHNKAKANGYQPQQDELPEDDIPF